MRYATPIASVVAAVGIVAALSGVVTAHTVANDITDEQVRQVMRDYRARWDALFTSGSVTSEDIQKLQGQALGDLDIAELSPKQLGMLHGANMIHGDAQQAAVARADQFLDDTSTKGAAARVLRLALLGGVTGPDSRPAPELQQELLASVFAHEALHAAIRDGQASIIIDAIRMLANRDLWKARGEDILALSGPIIACDDPAIASGFEKYFEVLEHVCTEQQEPLRQSIRARMVDRGRGFLLKAGSGKIELSVSHREFLDGSMARLDSLHARGTFIGSPAPALDFIWTSVDDLKSLDNLKGNVVVLDFWATWCGPCIASIPDIRQLQERYAGYPVKIVGITSIQGAHYNDEGKIDCADEPDKEMSLMAQFIEQKDISWSIAFSKQDVYNAEYGVGGIPHMTILAPDGTVRHNALHPSRPLAEKSAKIDAILREFELPAPPPIKRETQRDKSDDKLHM